MKKILLLLLALVVGIMWIWFGRRQTAPLSPSTNTSIPIVRKDESVFLDHKQVHTVPAATHPAHSHHTDLIP